MCKYRPVGRYLPGSLAAFGDLLRGNTTYFGVNQTAFGGADDYYTILGYSVDVSFDQCEAKYRQQDVAKVESIAKPNAIWKDTPWLPFMPEVAASENAQEALLAEWKSLKNEFAYVPDFESVGCAFESHRGYWKSRGIAWAPSNPLGNLERKSHAMTHLVTW